MRGRSFRLAALRPDFAARSPAIECLRRIAGLEFFITLLQPCVDKISSDVCDGRVRIVLCKDHGHLELAQKRNEHFGLETVVADLDHMAQRVAIECLREQFEEAAEIGLVEFLVRRELPEQGAEAGAQLRHARVRGSA